MRSGGSGNGSGCDRRATDLRTKFHPGCGHLIKEGGLNHDLAQLPGVDVVHDLREFPWPFAADAGLFGSAQDLIFHRDPLPRLPNLKPV